MIPRLLLLVLVAFSCPVRAADLPRVPSKPIAQKKELLFSDDFEGTARPSQWHKVVETFSFEAGALKGTQTREVNLPASGDKPEIKAHAAVHGLEIPTRDSIVECRIKFDGATMIDVEFDDRKYTGAHYGHICRAQIRLNGVTIIDERDGNMRNDIRAMAAGPEKNKLLEGRQVTYPVNLQAGKWYLVAVETAGDAMRVTIDGKRVAYLQSSGIGHETKSKIELGVAGKTGWFDDLKVWSAVPAR